jgi:hypothetical protein
MKVELRYLERETGNRYTTGGQTSFAIMETVLQYRQQQEVRAEDAKDWRDTRRVLRWSDWKDVPTVKEK